MSNKPAVPKEYQISESEGGFAFGEWKEIKRMVDAGYERFWNKRGGIPNRSLKTHFSPKNKNTPKD
jgi:hypothetical protein